MENPGSLSGQVVKLEGEIFINRFLQRERVLGICFFDPDYEGPVPEGHRTDGVPEPDYKAYRKGLDSACADIVITTRMPDGKPAVLAVKRKPGKCFANKWWMQGGAIQSYRPIADLLKERAKKECGVEPDLEGFIGVFRTAAHDVLACTTNLCFVGYAPYKEVAANFKTDADHSDHRLLTLDDLRQLPIEEQHWYPMRCFGLALMTTTTP